MALSRSTLVGNVREALDDCSLTVDGKAPALSISIALSIAELHVVVSSSLLSSDFPRRSLIFSLWFVLKSIPFLVISCICSVPVSDAIFGGCLTPVSLATRSISPLSEASFDPVSDAVAPTEGSVGGAWFIASSTSSSMSEAVLAAFVGSPAFAVNSGLAAADTTSEDLDVSLKSLKLDPSTLGRFEAGPCALEGWWGIS